MSKADLRSMNRVHNPLCFFFVNSSFTYSVSLNRLTSHPIPFLNPVCPGLSFQVLPSYRSFFKSVLRTVSNSLYIGDVFVIGLAL